MAEFCKQCTQELGLGDPEQNDFANLCADGEIVDVLCEGCGPTTVDEIGECIFHASGALGCATARERAAPEAS